MHATDLAMIRSVLAVVLVAVVVVACSSPSSGAASTACTTDAQCNGGLQCLGFATFTDGGCTESGKACSTPCTDDTSCASLGAKFKCFQGCGAAKFCGATQ